ncbi:conserved hypothetical protein [Candidatus Terasakiella magnetica]|uniref:Uncharacterized protein n=1 Tax=Candidatus Terasakiella magnetica TaxID=1867952 RepID=A0A1C3RHI8_9PROT|nr:hypothetical protein [Candidatus Terasakiella magnetica]SCA56746.1 conserved hypothetical protein [Candidatus Terasakiella magnetica]
MSDGPHYSLNMRKAWKRVAEKGDTHACSISEVKDALADALAADFKYENGSESIDKIKDILSNPQGDLLSNNPVEQLEQNRLQFSGHELSERFIDHIQEALLDGNRGEMAVTIGVENALAERSMRYVRSIEEHYLREDSRARSTFLRSRLDQAIRQSSFHEITSELSNSGNSSWKQKSIKKNDIDQGVSF